MANSVKVSKGTGGSIRTDPNLSPVSNNRILYEAVVTDFFSNPIEDLDKTPPNETVTYRESLLKGSKKVSNPERISKMPRGSISALVTSDGNAWGGGRPEIFYPLFPHMALPIKPGEKVWVIYESERLASSRGFWIGRISSDIDVDDPNYTHKDREFLYKRVPSETGALAAATGTNEFDEEIVYSFLAGSTGNISENTMPGDDPYNTIVGNSLSYLEQFTGEPVPRFSPRVGDLVLEGSNNTLICLGQDRPSLADAVDLSGFTGIGTIDMVAGRGQTEATSIAATVPISKRSEGLFDYEEGNKFPEFNNAGVSNIGEGNPDFTNDLSRVYVSMRTNGDTNFGLSFPSYESVGGDVNSIDDSPYVILKSTNNRIISREDGTIRIIKEGTEDTSRAVIVMEEDGTIMIDGPKIVIGSGIESINGSGNQVFIGRDATESIVLGDTLNSLLVDFLNSLLTSAPAFVATGVGPGVLSPTVVESIGTLINELSVLKSNLSKVGKTK